MRILSDDAIALLERELECFLVADKYYATLRFKLIDNDSYSKAEKFLKDNNINFHFSENTFFITQTELLDKFDTVDEHLWAINNKTQFVAADKLDHQRLSNMFWFLEVLLLNNTISKKDSEDYLQALKTDIAPIIQNKYGGMILDYKPFYDWEKTLYEKVKDRLGRN